MCPRAARQLQESQEPAAGPGCSQVSPPHVTALTLTDEFKGQFTPHRQTPTNSNKLVCWSLLDQCVTPVGVGTTRLNMLIDIELVGVCWCSVNMTVIFHKILNPTANLSQLVCWSLLAFVCAV